MVAAQASSLHSQIYGFVGRVSRHGAMALAWTHDKIGPMCHSAHDCGLVLDAIAGPDPEDLSATDRPYAYPPADSPGRPSTSCSRQSDTIGHDQPGPGAAGAEGPSGRGTGILHEASSIRSLSSRDGSDVFRGPRAWALDRAAMLLGLPSPQASTFRLTGPGPLLRVMR